MFKKKMRLVVAATVALTMTLGAGAAYAGHQFTDVPNSSPWHANVDWLAKRSITGGCGGGNYCPSDGVTRGQMAAFMERLGNVVTPKIYATNGFAVVQGDVTCQITVPATAYERQATTSSRAYASQSGVGDGFLFFRNVYSTNGGVSWTDVTGAYNIVDGAPGGSGTYMATTSGGAQALNPGTSYMFGMRINGAVNLGFDKGCALDVSIYNRQPGTVIETAGAPSGVATVGGVN